MTYLPGRDAALYMITCQHVRTNALTSKVWQWLCQRQLGQQPECFYHMIQSNQDLTKLEQGKAWHTLHGLRSQGREPWTVAGMPMRNTLAITPLPEGKFALTMPSGEICIYSVSGKQISKINAEPDGSVCLPNGQFATFTPYATEVCIWSDTGACVNRLPLPNHSFTIIAAWPYGHLLLSSPNSLLFLGLDGSQSLIPMKTRVEDIPGHCQMEDF